MKAKLREVEEYRCVLLEMDMLRRERVKDGKNTEAERMENAERDAAGVNSMVAETRSLTVVWKNVRNMRSRREK